MMNVLTLIQARITACPLICYYLKRSVSVSVTRTHNHTTLRASKKVILPLLKTNASQPSHGSPIGTRTNRHMVVTLFLVCRLLASSRNYVQIINRIAGVYSLLSFNHVDEIIQLEIRRE